MFIFRHGARQLAITSRTSSIRRKYASKIEIPFPAPPFPVIEACPNPTCQCREMPEGLDIDREQSLNGSMAAYAEQVLVSTGRNDWKSKIEDEDESVLVKQLKSLLGRSGKYSDPYHNVLLTNSSFPPTRSQDLPHLASDSEVNASAFLLPSFQYLPNIPADQPSVEALIKAYVLPSQLHQSHERLSRAEKNVLLRQPEFQRSFVGAREIDEILVLICGHGGRDIRCGTLGPILQQEFEEKLQRQNVALLHEAPVAEAVKVDVEVEGYTPTARTALISHIGGHKWAGNVIIYIPPSFKANALAGKGIWYGRVAPQDVEGIVAKTVMEGKVIKELFRGGIDQNREILRL